MKSSKKLYIQVSSSYAPSWGFGGPVRIFHDYACFLKDEFETIILTSDTHHNYKKIKYTEIDNDFKIIRFKTLFRFLVKKSVNIISFRMLIYAYFLIKNSKKNCVIHIWELRGLVNIYVKILKIIFKNKLKVIHSGFGQLHDTNSIFRKIYDPIFLFWTFSSVDVFVSENDHESMEYERVFLSKIKTKKDSLKLLPLHVRKNKNINNVINNVSKTEARKKFNLPIDSIIFLSLSRFNVKKGLKRVNDYAKDYSKISNKKICLIYAGKDEGFKKELQKFLEDAKKCENYEIIIIEDIFSDDRFNLYKSADIFLGFPLIFEETMLASLEALSVGTPVIVSKEASIPYLEKFKAGREIFSPESDNLFSVNKIISEYDTYSRGALDIIKNIFAEEIVTKNLVKIIKE